MIMNDRVKMAFKILDLMTDKRLVCPEVNHDLYNHCISISQLSAYGVAEVAFWDLYEKFYADKTNLQKQLYLECGYTESVSTYITHLIAGNGKGLMDIKGLRLLGLLYLPETMMSPLLITRQHNGRLLYTGMYKTPYGMLDHSVVVGNEQGQSGRIITSIVTADKKRDKHAARRELRRHIERAKEIIYVNGRLIDKSVPLGGTLS